MLHIKKLYTLTMLLSTTLQAHDTAPHKLADTTKANQPSLIEIIQADCAQEKGTLLNVMHRHLKTFGDCPEQSDTCGCKNYNYPNSIFPAANPWQTLPEDLIFTTPLTDNIQNNPDIRRLQRYSHDELNKLLDKAKNTPPCYYDQMRCLIVALICQGAYPNFNNSIALERAVLYSDRQLVMFLLARNAAPNATSKSFAKPILLINNISACIVTALLKHGADINGQDYKGETALHKAMSVTDRPHTTKLIKVLLAHGANPDAVNTDGGTPLINLAFSSGDSCCTECLENKAKLLLQAGAKTHHRIKSMGYHFDDTALQIAETRLPNNKAAVLVKILKEAGATSTTKDLTASRINNMHIMEESFKAMERRMEM